MNIPVVDPIKRLLLKGKIVSIPQPRLTLLVNTGLSGCNTLNTLSALSETVYKYSFINEKRAMEPAIPVAAFTALCTLANPSFINIPCCHAKLLVVHSTMVSFLAQSTITIAVSATKPLLYLLSGKALFTTPFSCMAEGLLISIVTMSLYMSAYNMLPRTATSTLPGMVIKYLFTGWAGLVLSITCTPLSTSFKKI